MYYVYLPFFPQSFSMRFFYTIPSIVSLFTAYESNRIADSDFVISDINGRSVGMHLTCAKITGDYVMFYLSKYDRYWSQSTSKDYSNSLSQNLVKSRALRGISKMC